MERLLTSSPTTYPKISPAALSTRPSSGSGAFQGESARTPIGLSVADHPLRRRLEEHLRAPGEVDPVVDAALGRLLDPTSAAPLVGDAGTPDLLGVHRREQGAAEVSRDRRTPQPPAPHRATGAAGRPGRPAAERPDLRCGPPSGPRRRCRAGQAAQPGRSMGLPGDSRSARADQEVEVGAGVGLLHVVDVQALPTAARGGERSGDGRRRVRRISSSSGTSSCSRRRGTSSTIGSPSWTSASRPPPPPPARRAAPRCRTPCRSSARRTPAPCRGHPVRASSAAAAGSPPRACPGTPSDRSRGAPAPSPV